jgi:RHS repeat-associated protein
VLAEVTNPGQTAQKWTDYLSVGDAMVGMRIVQTASETVTTRYFHADHLGSISVITNEAGAVVERLSYDAWGKRRNPNGTDDTTGSITSQSSRGFTGEEQLSVSGLVHLNGRVYDPIIARMTSADPTIPRPLSTQGWNRYAYASNRPLRNIDPDGFGDYDYLGVTSNGLTEAGTPDWLAYSPQPPTGFQQYGGTCSCGGMVYPTALPTPTSFPSFDTLGNSAALGASVSAMIQAGNAAASAQFAAMAQATLAAQMAGAPYVPSPVSQVQSTPTSPASQPSSTNSGNVQLAELAPDMRQWNFYGIPCLCGGAGPIINKLTGPKNPQTRPTPADPLPGNADEVGAASPGAHEAYKDGLRAIMSKPAVSDPSLARLIDELYRPNATVGSGSTADAVRQELATGQPVGGAFHSQKAEDSIRSLGRWLSNNPTASPGDRAAAENVIKDMKNALGGR